MPTTQSHLDCAYHSFSALEVMRVSSCAIVNVLDQILGLLATNNDNRNIEDGTMSGI